MTKRLDEINKEVAQLFPSQPAPPPKQLTAYHLFGISLGGPAYSTDWTNSFLVPGESPPSFGDKNLELITAGTKERPHYYIAIKSLTKIANLHSPKITHSGSEQIIYPAAFDLLKIFCSQYSIPYNNYDNLLHLQVAAGTEPNWFLALSELIPNDLR